MEFLEKGKDKKAAQHGRPFLLLKIMLNFVSSWLFPKKCIGCGKSATYFCAKCIKKQELYLSQRCIKCRRLGLDGLTHPKCKTVLSVEGIFVIFRYKGGIKKLIKEIKFRRVRSLVVELSELYAKTDSRLVDYWKRNNFVVTWVPISNTKLNKRGFNQAELLGRAAAAKFGLETEDCLKRNKDTKPQFELNKKERLKNIINSFEVKNNFKKGSNFLLIDDVITTGVTARECVKVLKRRGAGKVWVLVLAG